MIKSHHFHYLVDLDAFVCLPVGTFLDRQGESIFHCPFATRDSRWSRDCIGCCAKIPRATVVAAAHELGRNDEYEHANDVLTSLQMQKEFFETSVGLLVEVLIESQNG